MLEPNPHKTSSVQPKEININNRNNSKRNVVARREKHIAFLQRYPPHHSPTKPLEQTPHKRTSSDSVSCHVASNPTAPSPFSFLISSILFCLPSVSVSFTCNPFSYTKSFTFNHCSSPSLVKIPSSSPHLSSQKENDPRIRSSLASSLYA